MKNYYLEQIPILKNVPLDQHAYTIRKYEKTTMLYQAGDISQVLSIILEGEAIIQHINEEGQLITLTTFRRGDTIGGNRMFSSNPLFPMTITAKENLVMLNFEKTTVLEICQQCDGFLKSFLRDLADKSDLLSLRFRSLSFMTIEDQIIRFLSHRYLQSKNSIITLPFSKKEWSEKLGISRTSLSRTLQKMKKDGSLDFKNRTITLIKIPLFENINTYSVK